MITFLLGAALGAVIALVIANNIHNKKVLALEAQIEAAAQSKLTTVEQNVKNAVDKVV